MTVVSIISRDDAWRRLKPLLAQVSAHQWPISEDCRILQDLNLGGDDAAEFLDAVHDTFGTRFEGFVFNAYFPNETETMGEMWFRRLGFCDDRKAMTVGHLLDVIQRGAWFEPPAQDVAMPTGNRLRRYVVRGLVVVILPLAYVLAVVGAGEAFGLAPGTSYLLLGPPVAAVLAAVLWRRLPTN